MPKLLKDINIKLEYYKGCWIIWKSHNKDFTVGSYYRLNTNATIDLIIESYNSIQVIKDVTETNE